MIYCNKQQPLNNWLLTWNRKIQNMTGLNMLDGTNSGVFTKQHQNKTLLGYMVAYTGLYLW